MIALPFAVAAAALLVGCCAILLTFYCKSQFAASTMDLLERSEVLAGVSPLLPFRPTAPLGVVREDMARVSGLTLAEAEDLLDWLEQNGFEQRGLLCESGISFGVEFRMHSGHIRLPTSHIKPLRRYTAG
jgi:hypothetical protein